MTKPAAPPPLSASDKQQDANELARLDADLRALKRRVTVIEESFDIMRQILQRQRKEDMARD